MSVCVSYVYLVQKRALNPTELELRMLGATVKTLVLINLSAGQQVLQTAKFSRSDFGFFLLFYVSRHQNTVEESV